MNGRDVTREPLVGDPIPWRNGGWFNGPTQLTKREFAQMRALLATSDRLTMNTFVPSDDEDRWVAFLSLLHGAYIQPVPAAGSTTYRLTDKGRTYHRQLSEIP